MSSIASAVDGYRVVLPHEPLPPGVLVKTVAVMFLWAACFPLINLGSRYAPSFHFAGGRALLAGLGLLLPALWLRRAWPRGFGQWGLLAAAGFFTTGVGFWGMFVAGVNIAPGIATVLANTQPLLAAVLAFFVLNERLRPTVVAGLLVGFAGIVVIGFGGSVDAGRAAFGKGVAFVLLGAVGVAAGNVLLKRLAGKLDVLMAMGWQLLFGSVPLLAAAAWTESPGGIEWTPPFITILIVLSLLGTSAVFALWFDVLRHAQLGRLNAFTFLTPVLGLGMGVLLFGESFNASMLLGIGLAFAGIGLVIRRAPAGQSASPEDEQR